MHGFSYINRQTSAVVHISSLSEFDQDDQDELEKFKTSGRTLVKSRIDGLSGSGIAVSILNAISDSEQSYHLVWASLVDMLVGLSNEAVGLAVVLIYEDRDSECIPLSAVEFIEYFLIAANAWRVAKKPYHLVICNHAVS